MLTIPQRGTYREIVNVAVTLVGLNLTPIQRDQNRLRTVAVDQRPLWIGIHNSGDVEMIVATIQMWLRVVARRKVEPPVPMRKPPAALTPNKVVRYVRWSQCDTVFEQDGS